MSVALTDPTEKSRRNCVSDMPSLAILRDYAAEGWPSMELCADMLALRLRADHADRLAVVDVAPPFRRRLQRLPWLGRRRGAFNGDRLLNRLWDYPRHARRLGFDGRLFHIVDHSYAQLVHALPADRTGVYCHDLDTFQCLLNPVADPRPRWFRAMARHILAGLQKAALVFYSTSPVRAEIARFDLIDPSRLVHAPLGIAPEFRCATNEESAQPSPDGNRYVLHVGSCIPRKRIDVLLETFARLRSHLPGLTLVKVGGEWTADQRALVQRLSLSGNLVHLNGLDRQTLACLYRRASLVLMPSSAEGFGLPVLEALACGAPVLASNLPVFREVGGDAARYAPVGNVDAWVETALNLLRDPEQAGSVAPRVTHAERFSWRRHAEIIADAYIQVAR